MRGPEVLGQAGACRRQASYWMWLTGVLSELCFAYLPLTALCVALARRQAPSDPDSFFSDPDTLVLHLTTSAPLPLPRTRRPIQTTTGAVRRPGSAPDGSAEGSNGPSIELGKYEGHPESLDAPQWAKLLPVGQPIEFRESAAGLAELLARAAPWDFADAMAVSSSIRSRYPIGARLGGGADVRVLPAVAGIIIASAAVVGRGEPEG